MQNGGLGDARTSRTAPWLAVGAVSAAVAVAAGAFGAHALAEVVTPARLETWRTAASYHLVHSAALCLIGFAEILAPSIWLRRSAILLATGIALFAGSLYALVLLDAPFLGAVTPLGGVAFIGGWLCLAIGAKEWAVRARKDPDA